MTNMIELTAEWAKVETMTETQRLAARATLDALPDADLLQIARGAVRFLSPIAINACVRRGIWKSDLHLTKAADAYNAKSRAAA